MGQQASVKSSFVDGGFSGCSNRLELWVYFNEKCLKQYSVPELVAFKENLKGKSVEDALTNEEVMEVLRLGECPEILKTVILKLLYGLGSFPLLNEMNESLNGLSLLKALCIIDPERFGKFLGDKSVSQKPIIYVSLCELDNLYSKEQTFDPRQIIEQCDYIDYHNTSVDANVAKTLWTWILILSIWCPKINCTIDSSNWYSDWSNFEAAAMSVYRSLELKNEISEKTQEINFEQFDFCISMLLPNFLEHLKIFFEHMLFTDATLIKSDSVADSLEESRVLTCPTFSLLSAALPKQITALKVQKLYVGRESGFSMRSLQAKVFKWMAPSILLISGMRIADDTEYGNKNNVRYKKFLEKYPKLRDQDQHLDLIYIQKRKVQFAVYINEPWKVTNKTNFGDLETKIIQISPKFEVHKSVAAQNVYFNTMGGGIAIGSDQPTMKSNSTVFHPGNVSLTLDDTLEFGTFRHTGFGGKFAPSLQDSNKSFELRFLIQDIEVWGCGGKEELEEQLKQWEWEEAEAKRRQRVNLKTMGEDRALLEMAGIIGQHNKSGGSV